MRIWWFGVLQVCGRFREIYFLFPTFITLLDWILIRNRCKFKPSSLMCISKYQNTSRCLKFFHLIMSIWLCFLVVILFLSSFLSFTHRLISDREHLHKSDNVKSEIYVQRQKWLYWRKIYGRNARNEPIQTKELFSTCKSYLPKLESNFMLNI